MSYIMTEKKIDLDILYVILSSIQKVLSYFPLQSSFLEVNHYQLLSLTLKGFGFQSLDNPQCTSLNLFQLLYT